MERERDGHSALPPYDDYLDMLACQGYRLDPAVWDDLVDRLAVHDVTHLGGGSADYGRVSPYRGPADVDPRLLILDVAQAPAARLRDALIALLLRHPEDAAAVREVMDVLPLESPARMSLLARLLAAAALQREHGAAFASHLPGYPPIDVADLIAAYDLPSPEEEEGRLLLAAAQRLVRGRLKTVDYVDGWEDVARHALREALGVAAFERIVEGVGDGDECAGHDGRATGGGRRDAALEREDAGGDGAPLVGSSEPLTPAQTRRRLEELRAWGVDLSLVRYNLGLTPTQRIEEALRMRAAAEELRRAMRAARAGAVAARPSEV